MKEYIVEIVEDSECIRIHGIKTELIRCKNCKYSKPIDYEWLECQHDKRVMKENGFCSWAERRGEE